MNTSFKTQSIFFILTIVVALFIYSCSDDSSNPGNNNPTSFSITGTITFADTTRVYTGGSYNISAFTSWPPAGQPSAIGFLTPVLNGGVYSSTYSLTSLPNGYYYLATAWTKEPYVVGGNYVLGTYGCDTNSIFTCSPDSVVINSANVPNINYYSYIDTSKNLIRF